MLWKIVPSVTMLLLLASVCAWSADTTKPTGTVTINNNTLSTVFANVTLTVTASDNVITCSPGSGWDATAKKCLRTPTSPGVCPSPMVFNATRNWCESDNTSIKMSFSSDNKTWTAWENLAPTRAWTIPTALDGTVVVYARFQDAAGNISSTVLDNISYISGTAPLTATPGAAAGQVKLTWTSSINAPSVVAYATGLTPPAAGCSSGTIVSPTVTSVSASGGKAATISGLNPDTVYTFRLCLADSMGNRTPGVTDSAVVSSWKIGALESTFTSEAFTVGSGMDQFGTRHTAYLHSGPAGPVASSSAASGLYHAFITPNGVKTLTNASVTGKVDPYLFLAGALTYRTGTSALALERDNLLRQVDVVSAATAAVFSPSCPSGYTYNSATKTCVSLVPTCPTGLSYDQHGNCVAPLACPADSFYEDSMALCISAPIFNGWNDDIACPQGLTFDYNTGLCSAPLQCPSGSGLADNNYCYKPVCPAYTQYDANLNRCLQTTSPCPTNYNVVANATGINACSWIPDAGYASVLSYRDTFAPANLQPSFVLDYGTAQNPKTFTQPKVVGLSYSGDSPYYDRIAVGYIVNGTTLQVADYHRQNASPQVTNDTRSNPFTATFPAYQVATGFQVGSYDMTVNSDSSISIVVDVPVAGGYDLTLYTRDGIAQQGLWNSEVLVSGAAPHKYPALTTNGADVLVAYIENNVLTNVKKTGTGTTTISMVDYLSAGTTVQPSIYVDGTGKTHISYVESATTDSSLKEAIK